MNVTRRHVVSIITCVLLEVLAVFVTGAYAQIYKIMRTVSVSPERRTGRGTSARLVLPAPPLEQGVEAVFLASHRLCPENPGRIRLSPSPTFCGQDGEPHGENWSSQG